MYCFEKQGVLSDVSDETTVIPLITSALYTELRASGVIAKGMIPKMENAFAALKRGVSSVIIAHADSVRRLGENFSEGTTIVLE
jgi:acetylglutamate kinase